MLLFEQRAFIMAILGWRCDDVSLVCVHAYLRIGENLDAYTRIYVHICIVYI